MKRKYLWHSGSDGKTLIVRGYSPFWSLTFYGWEVNVPWELVAFSSLYGNRDNV